jgi:hypothetical protein
MKTSIFNLMATKPVEPKRRPIQPTHFLKTSNGVFEELTLKSFSDADGELVLIKRNACVIDKVNYDLFIYAEHTNAENRVISIYLGHWNDGTV